jgi:hypothetical protein
VLEAGTPLAPSDVTERQRTPRAAASAATPTRRPSPTGTGGTRARSPFLAVASPGGGEHLAAVQRPPVPPPPRELLEAEVGTSWRMPNEDLLGLLDRLHVVAAAPLSQVSDGNPHPGLVRALLPGVKLGTAYRA